MKILRTKILIESVEIVNSTEYKQTLNEIHNAIEQVAWPPGAQGFTLYPGKKRNGVKPIKEKCMIYLAQHGWNLEYRLALASREKPGPVDAVKEFAGERYYAVEWETGNISSTHRALNKMAIGLLDHQLTGGFLILPSREMYQWLTDRVGNFNEIEPYFPIWENLPTQNGILGIIEIEHDHTSDKVVPIPKGTDGRALI